MPPATTAAPAGGTGRPRRGAMPPAVGRSAVPVLTADRVCCNNRALGVRVGGPA